MPIYAYKCNKCQRQFDVRQRFSDDPLTECIYCDGQVRRLITQVGVVFKGNGFYVTDNRNGKANGSARSSSVDSDDSKASGTKETTSDSESKPPASKSSGNATATPPNPS